VRIAGHTLATVEGLTVSEAAQRLGVSRSTAHRMMVKSRGCDGA
jgi:transposase